MKPVKLARPSASRATVVARYLAVGCLLGGLLTGETGCGRKGISSELAAFKDAGRTLSDFAEQDPAAMHAKRCQTGTIDQISTLLCEYQSPESAALGQAAAEAWFGETSTALVLRRDLLVLALSDRNHVDAQGKTISTLAKIFRRIAKR